ncbi:hypothetical protein Q3V23_13915 [Streptomyces sp. VNUA116]|uniref:hypothetical protein n=1 Tax=Streptomyces sp. VNUA116 TaxID=3062449 RepID=UPI002674EC6A|nr:hypothetical protein [Streptomyces sp. VNUA116]WKU45078.1 hypothetical protein Q3V23_13915 [Streptomyces sp. VNUA116]
MTDHTPPRSDKDPRFPPMCTPVEDFYALPHQQLQAMVEHADVHRVIAVGLQLNGAAQAIKKLGDDLKKHMEGVVWSGEAGEAFRKWGHSMANETIRLSEYVKTANEWIGYASTDLGRATRMPKYSPEDKATVDAWLKNHPLALGKVPMPGLEPLGGNNLVSGGPTQKEAYDAQQRLDDNHKAAAGLMKALSESYDQTGTQLLRVARPNFPPMPDKVMPPVRDPEQDGREHVGLSGDASGARLSGGAAGASAGGYAGREALGRSAGGVSGPFESAEQIGRRPNLDLSGGVEAPHRVPVPQPDRPPVVLPDPGKPQIPVPHVPVPNWPGPEQRPDVGRRPGRPIPDRGGRPTPGVPTPGTGPGASRRPDVRLPNVPRDGIVGGRPTPRGPSVPTQNPGRVPVFGTEPSPRQGPARPSMVPGTGFGGMPGPGTGSPGAGAGRVRATEPGGVVGGRPGGGGSAFTPGGTGLVRGAGAGESRNNSSGRNGMMGGFMPTAGVGSASSERQAGGRRPDYLVEDEETWNQDGKRVMPPVIE